METLLGNIKKRKEAVSSEYSTLWEQVLVQLRSVRGELAAAETDRAQKIHSNTESLLEMLTVYQTKLNKGKTARESLRSLNRERVAERQRLEDEANRLRNTLEFWKAIGVMSRLLTRIKNLLAQGNVEEASRLILVQESLIRAMIDCYGRHIEQLNNIEAEIESLKYAAESEIERQQKILLKIDSTGIVIKGDLADLTGAIERCGSVDTTLVSIYSDLEQSLLIPLATNEFASRRQESGDKDYLLLATESQNSFEEFLEICASIGSFLATKFFADAAVPTQVFGASLVSGLSELSTNLIGRISLEDMTRDKLQRHLEKCLLKMDDVAERIRQDFDCDTEAIRELRVKLTSTLWGSARVQLQQAIAQAVAAEPPPADVVYSFASRHLDIDGWISDHSNNFEALVDVPLFLMESDAQMLCFETLALQGGQATKGTPPAQRQVEGHLWRYLTVADLLITYNNDLFVDTSIVVEEELSKLRYQLSRASGTESEEVDELSDFIGEPPLRSDTEGKNLPQRLLETQLAKVQFLKFLLILDLVADVPHGIRGTCKDLVGILRDELAKECHRLPETLQNTLVSTLPLSSFLVAAVDENFVNEAELEVATIASNIKKMIELANEQLGGWFRIDETRKAIVEGHAETVVTRVWSALEAMANATDPGGIGGGFNDLIRRGGGFLATASAAIRRGFRPDDGATSFGLSGLGGSTPGAGHFATAIVLNEPVEFARLAWRRGRPALETIAGLVERFGVALDCLLLEEKLREGAFYQKVLHLPGILNRYPPPPGVIESGVFSDVEMRLWRRVVPPIVSRH